MIAVCLQIETAVNAWALSEGAIFADTATVVTYHACTASVAAGTAILVVYAGIHTAAAA